MSQMFAVHRLPPSAVPPPSCLIDYLKLHFFWLQGLLVSFVNFYVATHTDSLYYDLYGLFFYVKSKEKKKKS